MKIIKFADTLLEEQGSGDLPAISGKKKSKKKKSTKKMKWTSGIMAERCGYCGVGPEKKKKKNKKKKKLFEEKKNKKGKCCKGVEYGKFKGKAYTGKIIAHKDGEKIMYI
jgi:hypothetical protein